VVRAPGLTRVTIVEDHALFAESLEAVLTMQGYDVRRVDLPPGVAPAGRMLGEILKTRPRVVVLDLDLGRDTDGARMIEPLVRTGIAVVVVTGSGDRVRWGECLRHGARAVLDKAAPLNHLIAALRLIVDGRAVMSREEREGLVLLYHREKLALHDLRARLHTLTPREAEVLRCLMSGRTVRDIAEASVVAEATVRSQVKSVLAKLQVSSQIAAVGAAHHAGWHA
jgi:DNA-binding NarL/FixJ family response regulator